MTHPLENSKTWLFILVAFAVVVIGAITVISFTSSPATPASPTPDNGIIHAASPLPTEVPRPRTTPSPRPGVVTPTPRPTPPPEPIVTPAPRYCETNSTTNETICYVGIAPTPTPTPTPTPVPTATPTPAPNWVTAGLVCEVPDRLLGERWATAAYKYACTCAIRAAYQLGLDFSPFEGCHAAVATSWREASCNCVTEICAHEPGIC